MLLIDFLIVSRCNEKRQDYRACEPWRVAGVNNEDTILSWTWLHFLSSRFCHVESYTWKILVERKENAISHHWHYVYLYQQKDPLSAMAPVRGALLVSYLPLLFLPCQALSIMSMSATSPKHVLFDVNVSNNGARCRLILYKVSALWWMVQLTLTIFRSILPLDSIVL
jgi:hypothetical protein